MNEALFLLHIFVVISAVYAAARWGKEALIASTVLLAICANLFVIKQIKLFGLEVTGADPLAVGSMLGLNLLQQRWGEESAQRALSACFGALLLFSLFAQIHLLYRPSLHDTSQNVFFTLLAPAPRLFLASLISFLISQRANLLLLRSFSKPLVALSIAALLDTALFTLLGLAGIAANLLDVFLLSMAIKMVVISSSIPLAMLWRRHAL